MEFDLDYLQVTFIFWVACLFGSRHCFTEGYLKLHRVTSFSLGRDWDASIPLNVKIHDHLYECNLYCLIGFGKSYTD